MKRAMNMNELEKVSGGFYIGSDRYTKEEYAEAGITWEHNFWTKDRYYYKGKQITQDEAEQITMLYQSSGIVHTIYYF